MGVINLAHGSFYMIGAISRLARAGVRRQFLLDAARRVVLCGALRLPARMAVLLSSLPARPPAAGVDDVRPDPRLRGSCAASCVDNDVHGVPVPRGSPAAPVGRFMSYPVYRLLRSPRSACGGRLIRHRAHAARHDDPRGQLEPGDDPVAGHQHQAVCTASVFAAGVALAALAGHDRRAGVLGLSGHGRQVLIVCFVVVVIGGIGSSRGASRRHSWSARRHLRQGVLLPESQASLYYLLMAIIPVWCVPRAWRRRRRLSTARRSSRHRASPGCRRCCSRSLRAVARRRSSTSRTVIVKIQILAIFTLSLDLLVGARRLVSLGHAAYAGLAAHRRTRRGARSAVGLWLTAVGALGVVRGSPPPPAVVRRAVAAHAGVYFIMVTLAFAQMAYFRLPRHPKFGRRQRRRLYLRQASAKRLGPA